MVWLECPTYFATLLTVDNPFRTAVPFWEQTTQIISSLAPKQDCSPKRVTTKTIVEKRSHHSTQRSVLKNRDTFYTNYSIQMFLIFMGMVVPDDTTCTAAHRCPNIGRRTKAAYAT